MITDRRRGFTLIELLVVIAIIALLMAILMPALGRIRAMAKDITGISNMRQLDFCLTIYADENDGLLPTHSFACDNMPEGRWPNAIGDFIKDPKVLLCPYTTSKNPPGPGETFKARWKTGPPPDWPWAEGKKGSYGINNWACSVPPTLCPDIYENNPDWVGPAWGTPNVKGADTIPLLLDCTWWAGRPYYKNSVPESEGEWAGGMSRFCINRHNGRTIGCFLDGSARKIPLKCLWELQWHREWYADQQAAPPTDWSYGTGWMKKFPECKLY